MLSADQQEAARNDPLSFRHAAGRGAGSSQTEVASWLAECHNQGVLRAVGPTVFVYQQGDADLAATGIIADVRLSAYDSGLVKRHERTIAKTQRKMADYMRGTRIFGNPVALTHRPHAGLQATIKAHVEREADIAFTTADSVSHRLWAIEGDAAEEVCLVDDGSLRPADALAPAAVRHCRGKTQEDGPGDGCPSHCGLCFGSGTRWRAQAESPPLRL